MKILVADDDNLNRMMISRLLEKLGGDCVIAEDGHQAVEKFSKDDFKIVFLDFNMPVYSGEECAKLIIEHCESKAAKAPMLVCVSADEEHGENAVFDDFLPKPFKIEKLKEIIDRASLEA